MSHPKLSKTTALRTPRGSSPFRALAKLATAAVCASVMALTLVLGLAGPAAATPTVRSEPGDTTTTQPTDYRVPGRSLTRPNEGMEPQDAGDPGGWLQSSLFFIVCGAVIVLAVIVWKQSQKARAGRSKAGLDPVALAKASGEGVRQPSPLDHEKPPAPDSESSADATE